jgi:hypothetical protein
MATSRELELQRLKELSEMNKKINKILSILEGQFERKTSKSTKKTK